jgi:hypothetical protein
MLVAHLNLPLVVKVFLAPLLIVGASVVGRRWGPRAAGLFAGLPLTSAPISVVLYLQYGPAFASDAAAGVVTGLEGVIAFCWTYAWLARRSRGICSALFAGTIAYASVIAVLIGTAPQGLATRVLIVAATLACAVVSTKPVAVGSAHDAADWAFDTALRVGLAVSMVVGLTAVAAQFGAELSGVLSPFPLFAAIMATFTHQRLGGLAAVAFLRGVLKSTSAFVAFFFSIAIMIKRGPIEAYGTATASAIIVQVLSTATSKFLRVRGLQRAPERSNLP